MGPPIPSSPELFLCLPGAPMPGLSGGTCKFSMGRVTLYKSMVLMMMAGVVRKKKRKKRKVLIAIKRAHQWKRRTDRCFLGGLEEGDALRTLGLSPQTQPRCFLHASCGPGCPGLIQPRGPMPACDSPKPSPITPLVRPWIHPTGEPKELSEFFPLEKPFPQRLSAFCACGGVGLGAGRGCDAQERHSPAEALYERGQALILFLILQPSSIPKELKGEQTDRGGLPNNFFGVRGTDYPPLVGFDDGGH